MQEEGNISQVIRVNEEKVLTDFERLSKEGKREVADFIAHLKAREEFEATKEFPGNEDFLQSIMRGDEDFKAGHFKKWSEVKENV